MGFIGRLKIGFAMARSSGRVLRGHPKLFVFPLLGGLSGIVFLATLFGGLSLTGPLLRDPGQAVYAALFVAYLLETFVASFFLWRRWSRRHELPSTATSRRLGGRSSLLGGGNCRCWLGRSLPQSSAS